MPVTIQACRVRDTTRDDRWFAALHIAVDEEVSTHVYCDRSFTDPGKAESYAHTLVKAMTEGLLGGSIPCPGLVHELQILGDPKPRSLQGMH